MFDDIVANCDLRDSFYILEAFQSSLSFQRRVYMLMLSKWLIKWPSELLQV